MWRSFIPFSTYGVFQRGGYFISDVIPDVLSVVSLNTIYFYDSNKGEYRSPSTIFCRPGTRHGVPLQRPWVGFSSDSRQPRVDLQPHLEGVYRSWSQNFLIRHHRLLSELIRSPPFLHTSYLLAVGGCEYTQHNDPGNLQLDWLEVQLGIFRDKGINVSVATAGTRLSPNRGSLEP